MSASAGLTFDSLKAAKTKLLAKGFLPILAHHVKKHPLGKWKTYTASDWSKSLKCITGAKANIGILTGSKSGVIVLDIDNKTPKFGEDAKRSSLYRTSTGIEDWKELCDKNGGEPATLRCVTPSGGRHYYFQEDADLYQQVKTTNTCVMSIDDLLCAIDIRGEGGFVVCPPSISVVGQYVWQPNNDIKDVPILPMPAWIKDNIIKTCTKEVAHMHVTKAQKNHTEMFANDPTDNEDFNLFKASPFFKNHRMLKIDDFNRMILQETIDFDCSICERKHVNHNNHPFLVRRNDRLLFVCRQSTGDQNFSRYIEEKPVAEEEKKDDTPHYLLMTEIWKHAKKNRLLKLNGYIYAPVEGKPCAYQVLQKYEDYINVVLGKNKLFKSSPKRFNDIMAHLKLYNDDDLRFMIRDRNVLAFANGVLMLDSMQFSPYTDKAVKNKVARNYIDQIYTGKTYTPLFDEFLMYQLASDNPEADKSVMEMILAMIGRGFFQVNQHDKWKIAPLFYGESNTGKTTLLMIIKAMFSTAEIGTISANQERSFGLEPLFNKDVIFIPDMPINFREVIEQTIFQNIIDGDDVNINEKHKAAFSGRLRSPIFMAGNVFPNYPDKKGAMVNRLPVVLFDKYVPNKNNSLESTIITNELPNLITKCLQSYWKILGENEGKTFWNIAPLYFHENKEYAKTATNWLHRFLTASPDENKSSTAKFFVRQKVLPGENRLKIPLSDVQKAFQKFMTYNHPQEKYKWDDTDHATFKALGYTIEIVNTCKSCFKRARGGKNKCCDQYSAANRTKRSYVYDMELVRQEVLSYVEVN
ncbi:hypothetical protein PhCBS80983_g06285 [Powellomyces hirtus]|uniref:SF3 helicase domain-containing protein n=1 Tax=Powellomyces hirtus TaxID=109895 RepID=A0A507DP67_9FUNG|nr:hypothetical protein PhCBS80983_g06285 [Powellomyces hirtus]